MKRHTIKSRKSIGNSKPAKFTAAPPALVPAKSPLSAGMLAKMDAWWRAANYLSVGQIYLYDNPLLKKPLEARNTSSRGW